MYCLDFVISRSSLEFFDSSSVVFSVNQRVTSLHFSPSYHHYRFPPKMRFDKNEILQINKSILITYNVIVNNLGFQKIRSTFNVVFFSLVCAYYRGKKDNLVFSYFLMIYKSYRLEHSLTIYMWY